MRPLYILCFFLVLCGCTGVSPEIDRTDISMPADSAAYIEMLEEQITQKVLEKERASRNMMLTVIILTVIVSSVIVDRISIAKRKTEIRNKWLKRDIAKLEREMEILSGMKEEGVLNDEMKTLLEERLNVLNGFITAHISGNCSERAYDELEKLMSDRNSFIESTRMSFIIGHPRFLAFLKEKGLTDLEIGYCCLHAIGLRGKEIVAYLNSRSYYNASSAIRKKLGLNEHDTNINLYIQKLLKEIDEETPVKSSKS
ncbi:MAG: hypothetical protein IJ940_03320 [Bacteroidales bacterium]|nr:hypothetical protein [Bacteroidales bacterium]